MAYSFKQVLSDRKDLTKRRRIVRVEFAEPYTYETYESYDEVTGEGVGTPTTVNNERLFDKTLEFSLNETNDNIKARFKEFLVELNQEVTPVADIDYTPEAEPTPDPADVAFDDWKEKLDSLVAIAVGESLGLTIATATQKTTILNAVQTGFVKTDQRYISALAQYNKTI